MNKKKFYLLFGLAVILTLILVLGNFYLYFNKTGTKEVSGTPGLYKVVDVIDGDTIQVEFNGKIENVRLLGVDTPEVNSPYTEEECFGPEAKEYAEQLLKNKDVYLIPDKQNSDRDKYDRLLRYVFLPDGLFVEAELIKNGFAYNYIYEPFEFMKYFNLLEREAMNNKVGLWGACQNK